MTINRTLVISSLIFITSCGYQLRGSGDYAATSLSSVSIRASAAKTVAAQVRSQLQLSGVDLEKLESDYILNINNESYNRSIISVSATTGRVEEYQLTLSTTVSASKKDENTIINNETITVTRDYAYDESAVLGNDNEETTIKEDMARQAASRIIRRLNAASR
jgi:LPS-assembly lipoprotein